MALKSGTINESRMQLFTIQYNDLVLVGVPTLICLMMTGVQPKIQLNT